jgi:hypothetical protein
MRGKLGLLMVVAILAASGLLGASMVYATSKDYNDATNPSVGAVGLGDYNQDGDYYDTPDDLRYAVSSATGFYTWLYSRGWNSYETFFFADNEACERYFKRHDAGYGGVDIYYADGVDICWFQGHSALVGYPGLHHALSFINTMHDDKYLEWFEAKWGDWDLEWMFLHTCKILSDENWNWIYWQCALSGIHLICGAATTMHDCRDGPSVASLLTKDSYYDEARSVKYSWFHGCDYRQASDVLLRVMGGSYECGNDYIWGQGPVCADPPPPGDYSPLWEYYCT